MDRLKVFDAVAIGKIAEHLQGALQEHSPGAIMAESAHSQPEKKQQFWREFALRSYFEEQQTYVHTNTRTDIENVHTHDVSVRGCTTQSKTIWNEARMHYDTHAYYTSVLQNPPDISRCKTETRPKTNVGAHVCYDTSIEQTQFKK